MHYQFLKDTSFWSYTMVFLPALRGRMWVTERWFLVFIFVWCFCMVGHSIRELNSISKGINGPLQWNVVICIVTVTIWIVRHCVIQGTLFRTKCGGFLHWVVSIAVWKKGLSGSRLLYCSGDTRLLFLFVKHWAVSLFCFTFITLSHGCLVICVEQFLFA